jgi:hypothetical protein
MVQPVLQVAYRRLARIFLKAFKGTPPFAPSDFALIGGEMTHHVWKLTAAVIDGDG